jgi:protein gp37
MDWAWARALRDECQRSGVAFFFKQAKIDDRVVETPELDGQKWIQFPEAANADS